MTSSGKWPITQLTKRSIFCFPIPRGTLFFHPNTTWVLSQENLTTITYTKVGGGGNRMHHLHAPHNIPCLPPKILHQHCLQFLLRRHYKMQNLAVGGILQEMCTWNGAGRNSQLLFFFLFTTLKLKSFIILWIIWPKRTHLLQCKCVLTDPKRLLMSKNQYNDNFPWLPCIR